MAAALIRLSLYTLPPDFNLSGADGPLSAPAGRSRRLSAPAALGYIGATE